MNTLNSSNTDRQEAIEHTATFYIHFFFTKDEEKNNWSEVVGSSGCQQKYRLLVVECPRGYRRNPIRQLEGVLAGKSVVRLVIDKTTQSCVYADQPLHHAVCGVRAYESGDCRGCSEVAAEQCCAGMSSGFATT